MNDDLPYRFQRNELGLLLPAIDGPTPREVPYVATYLTYRELTGGRPMREVDLVDRLRKLSAADCLAAIAHLSTRLFADSGPATGADLQRRLVADVAGDGELGRALEQTLRDPRWTAVFCEQQLVHLARLVILHADRRPLDDFASRSLYDDWVTCLIGVSDLLDADLVIEDRGQRLAWEIRQCELNHHEDQLPVNAIHYEVYRVLWPELDDRSSREVEQAFQRHTGMTIGDYFTVGSAVMARLTIRGQQEDTIPGINPAHYFSSAQIAEATWRAFFDLNACELGALRAELLKEESRYGATTYGSLTFDRFPLIEIEPGLFLPLSMASLQRRITQGVFHILNAAAESDGQDRRYYSSAFGRVFQASVEQTLRRGLASVPITADIPYGPRTRRRQSSDVIVGYDRNPVFVEVVSGPLQAGTVTRGDLTCFAADTDRLVVGKARQLDQCIRDFFAGDMPLDTEPALVNRAWPVIVTSHSFPHFNWVTEEVERRVRVEGYLRDDRIGRLAIVSAEDLFFCEGFMQQGRSFLGLIRGWKSGDKADLPFKNYLIALGGGRAPGSDHFERRFAEANADYMHRLLGSEFTADDVLAQLRNPEAPEVD